MNRCVCLGLGAYVDGDEASGGLRVEPCDRHPLPAAVGETPALVAGLRVDHCLEAIAKVRDLLWPDGKAEAPWPSDRIEEIARALNFLRPGAGQESWNGTAAATAPTGPTVTVTLDRVVTHDLDVELPTSCPHCGLSFHEDQSLLEEGYCATNQPCAIAMSEGELVIDGYTAAESVYDLGLVTGYQCAGCRTTLVSTGGHARLVGGKGVG